MATLPGSFGGAPASGQKICLLDSAARPQYRLPRLHEGPHNGFQLPVCLSRAKNHFPKTGPQTPVMVQLGEIQIPIGQIRQLRAGLRHRQPALPYRFKNRPHIHRILPAPSTCTVNLY